MGGETQERRKMSPVVFSKTEVQPCRLFNTLRVGDDPIPGVTVEGVGVMVPGAKYNNICEQPQDSRIMMTQQLDGSVVQKQDRSLDSLLRLGRVKDIMTKRESSFCQAL